MAKPVMTVSTDDPVKFVQMAAIAGIVFAGGTALSSGVVAAPLAPPPLAPAPPPVAVVTPPPPAVVVAPPPPPAPVAAAAVIVPGGISQEQLIQKMAEKASRPGAPAALSALMAQYNAKAPGTPGPISNVDPAQYANLSAALDAL